MKNALFVSGTGTDVGKTVATAALLRALLDINVDAMAIKPVQTGMEDKSAYRADEIFYASALKSPSPSRCSTLYSFAIPASPHLASGMEKQHINLEALKQKIEEKASNHSLTLIEGAGGLMVPLNESDFMIDIPNSLDIPVILVVANILGAINHTLLSIEALRMRGIKLDAIIVTHTEDTVPDATTSLILEDNIQWLRKYAEVYVLPYCKQLHEKAQIKEGWERLSQFLLPLASRIHRRLTSTPVNCSPVPEESDLTNFDRNHLWHPYTGVKEPLPAYEVIRTKNNIIYLRDGRQLIDGMSSWWCALHGYSHSRLVRALQEQAASMPHVMFGGITHAPAVELGKLLLKILPNGLDRIFYADSGSVAVEVALKMAVQYWHSLGYNDRSLILTPRGGYHGDTVGAMSVCDPVNGMHTLFNGILPKQIFIERPSCRFDRPFNPDSLLPLNKAFEIYGNKLAAVILEPIVQGAGGMWFYHPEYLKHLHSLCRKYDVLLIFDEIATGFGRTGKLFATEWLDGATPDIMCLGKALTGGCMTFSATVCSQRVAEGICANGHVFMHGPTFMANPLACAVAKESIKLLLQSQWQRNVMRLENSMKKGLEACRDKERVHDVRILGGIGVIEMKKPVDMAKLQAFFVKEGVWIRPFGRLIYLMPPYISSERDVLRLCQAVKKAIDTGIA